MKKLVYIVIVALSDSNARRLAVDISDNNHAVKIDIGSQRSGTVQTAKKMGT
ncbi:MAG: hypothetical protein ACFFAZ_11130 [Promethearchaeota archaeon]